MTIADLVRERGRMTVAAFMDLALYDSELGYYARAAQRSGRAGDFFTSVDVGPLFGELLEIQLAEMAETPEYTGHVIAAMADDPDIMSISGQTVIGAEIAPDRYGLTDAGGKKPMSHRPFLGDPRVAHPAIIR